MNRVGFLSAVISSLFIAVPALAAPPVEPDSSEPSVGDPSVEPATEATPTPTPEGPPRFDLIRLYPLAHATGPNCFKIFARF